MGLELDHYKERGIAIGGIAGLTVGVLGSGAAIFFGGYEAGTAIANHYDIAITAQREGIDAGMMIGIFVLGGSLFESGIKKFKKVGEVAGLLTGTVLYKAGEGISKGYMSITGKKSDGPKIYRG
jgi:hypothetical protein